MERVQIEGDSESVYITVLTKKGAGYIGASGEISKQKLINILIEEGTLKDGETVYLEDDSNE